MDEIQIKKQIHIENEGRKIANLVMPKLLEKFKQFEGKQILKSDFTLLKKVEDEIKPILEEHITVIPIKSEDYAKISSIYLKTSEYSVYLCINLCFNGGDYDNRTYYCQYSEKSPYICNIKNKVLESFIEFKPYELLNVYEQIDLYKEASIRHKQLEDIKDKLFYSLRKEF